MDYLKQNHLSLLIIVYLVVAPMLGGSGPLGALDRTTVSNPWTFAGAVTHSSTLTQTGAATFTADATFNGGDDGIIITTTNTATSSLEVGCIQMPATSTASKYKLVVTSYATTTATFGHGTAAFEVVAVAGTCP